MRISHVVETLNRGGLERVVVELVRAQRRRGHECNVVCLYHEGLYGELLRREGFEVVDCGKRDGFDAKALWRMRRALRRHRTEVLHSHNGPPHYYARLAAIGLGIPCIVNTRHGMGATTRHARRERLFRWTVRHTDAVVAVCDAARRRFVENGGLPADKVVTVRNGIDLDGFPPSNDEMRTALRRELGLAFDSRVIGAVGRLDSKKDPMMLLDAFTRIAGRDSRDALVYVGDGALRPELVATATERGLAARVRFLGDRDDVARWLQGFDVFALPSLTEGYSLALLEACAAALPIVATDVGGNPEIVREGINGTLVPAANPEAMANALTAMLSDPVQAARMGEAGRAWVVEQGSVDAMVSRYEELYRACG